MSLRWKDVCDDSDLGPYLTGPFRVVGSYVCDRCDKMRCTLIVEHSGDGEYDDTEADLLQSEVTVPCPFADPPVTFRNVAPSDGGWQMNDACDLAYRTCPTCHVPLRFDPLIDYAYKSYCPECGHTEFDTVKPVLMEDVKNARISTQDE